MDSSGIWAIIEVLGHAVHFIIALLVTGVSKLPDPIVAFLLTGLTVACTIASHKIKNLRKREFEYEVLLKMSSGHPIDKGGTPLNSECLSPHMRKILSNLADESGKNPHDST